MPRSPGELLLTALSGLILGNLDKSGPRRAGTLETLRASKSLPETSPHRKASAPIRAERRPLDHSLGGALCDLLQGLPGGGSELLAGASAPTSGARAGGRCFGVAAGRRSRCHNTARQLLQIWTWSSQIDTGVALHTLQKPSRVSVGAAGTGRWTHSGVWRYGEAGMLSPLGERGLVLLPGDGVQPFTSGRASTS